MTDLFERPSTQGTQAAPSRAALRERRAARKRRRRRRRNSAIVVIALCSILVGGYFAVRNMDSVLGFPNPVFEIKDYDGPGHGSTRVTVPQGATGSEIGQILTDADVVQSTKAFIDAYNANPGSSGIQPGTYELKLQMKASDAVAALVSGQMADNSTLTIAEGSTVAQIVDRASSVSGIPAADFEAALADPASIGLPAEANGKAEGWLFPTKYVLDPDETAQSLLKKMVTTTTLQLDQLGVPQDQRETVLNKASIVQREAPAGEEGKVARVIENRLAKPMPLAMDAIDSYGLGKPADQITTAEFRDENLPYASRVHNGLPPTPIANPGLDAIKAVLSPTDGNWLFFVTVNLDTGETKYTDSYDEFLEFEKEYQAWAKANPSETPTESNGTDN